MPKLAEAAKPCRSDFWISYFFTRKYPTNQKNSLSFSAGISYVA